MSGKNLRTKKLFRNKKNLVISALDHVSAYGVQAGIVVVSIGKDKQQAECKLDETAPTGFVLVSRSSMFAIHDITPVTLDNINRSDPAEGNREK